MASIRLAIRLTDRRGAALVLALVMLVILSLMGITAVLTSGTGILIAGNQRVGQQTFYCADAGLDRAIADHLYELASASPDWSNSTLVTPTGSVTFTTTGAPLSTSLIARPSESNWLASNDVVRYADGNSDGVVTMGNCTYRVRVLRVNGQTKEIYIRSRGEQSTGGVTNAKVLVAHLKVVNASPWSSAVFGGSGAGGTITGNVEIHGVVHILGEGATPSTVVLPLGGTVGVYNNYSGGSGLPTTFQARIPDQTTLDATLRVKAGKVNMSGSASVGQASAAFAGVYVTDGITLSGTGAVYSDNGYPNSYDLGNKVKMPSLKNSAASGGADPGSPTVEQDFNWGTYSGSGALIIGAPWRSWSASDLTSACTIDEETGSFRLVSIANLISWDWASKILLVSGKISLESVVCSTYTENPGESDDGQTMTIGKLNGAKIISVSGRGTIFAGTDTNHSGAYPNILIRGDGLLTLDSSTTTYRKDFPYDHALGLMTGRKLMIYMDAGNNQAMGAFYAGGRVRTDKQFSLAGTTLSSTFDTKNTPAFYQVPALSDNVPPGMPAGPPLWIFSIREIYEVANPQQ